MADLPPTASRTFGISGLSSAGAGGASSTSAATATAPGMARLMIIFSPSLDARNRRAKATPLQPPVITAITSYLEAMRPEDVLQPTPAGVCCKLGRISYRPDPSRGQGRDHPRPFRPRARRPRRGARDAGDARPDALAPWRGLRRLHAGAPLWRYAPPRRRQGDGLSRRPRARLG